MDKNRKQENSIIDIAEALGVSAATVSRALNNNPRISLQTTTRVKEMAEKMGYRHNSMASSLRNKRSKIIGLIVPRISMYFHAVFITALQNRLQNEGYSLMVCQSNDAVEVEKKLAATLYSSRVDALVVSLTLHTQEYGHFDGFVNNDIPLIFYDRVPSSNYPAQIIKGDDYNGGWLAGRHLVESGCQHIAYISGPLSCNLYKERKEGFLEALHEADLTISPDWIFYQELTSKNAKQVLNLLFSGPIIPDGLFAGNDTTAVAAVEFARSHGFLIPDKLKIIGYSNDPRSAIITPAITTIDQHPKEMAERVAVTLFKLLQKKKKEEVAAAVPEIVPVSLVKRMTA